MIRWRNPDERTRSRERELRHGGPQERARLAALRRRQGQHDLPPVLYELGLLPAGPRLLPDRVMLGLESMAWGLWENMHDDSYTRDLARELTDEQGLAYHLDYMYEDPWTYAEWAELMDAPGLTLDVLREAINRIMPMERRKRLMAQAWQNGRVREEAVDRWEGNYERARLDWLGRKYPGDPGAAAFLNVQQNPPVRPCGAPVARLGVHLIQRRPQACVVLLDLDNVEAYGPAELEQHGLCPMLAGWGVRGGPMIARRGLERRLAAELAQPGRHQFVPELVGLAWRLGMDLLEVEDALCREGAAWHQAKGYDPAEAMLLLNNPPKRRRRRKLDPWGGRAPRCSVVTGSRVYGTPRPDSDIDLVVFMRREDLDLLRKIANDDEMPYQGRGYKASAESFRFGRLNLVAVTNRRDMEVWRKGTGVLLRRAPVTRDEAVALFERLRQEAEREKLVARQEAERARQGFTREDYLEAMHRLMRGLGGP